MPIGSKTMLSSQFYIEIAGQSLSGPVSSQLLSAEVEQHSLLPDTFTIRLSDPDLKLLDDGPFKLAEKITLKAEPEQEDDPARELEEGRREGIDARLEFGELPVQPLGLPVLDGLDQRRRLGLGEDLCLGLGGGVEARLEGVVPVARQRQHEGRDQGQEDQADDRVRTNADTLEPRRQLPSPRHGAGRGRRPMAVHRHSAWRPSGRRP